MGSALKWRAAHKKNGSLTPQPSKAKSFPNLCYLLFNFSLLAFVLSKRREYLSGSILRIGWLGWEFFVLHGEFAFSLIHGQR
jgi:hypothetical protein